MLQDLELIQAENKPIIPIICEKMCKIDAINTLNNGKGATIIYMYDYDEIEFCIKQVMLEYESLKEKEKEPVFKELNCKTLAFCN